MKILIVTQYFYPESTLIPTTLTSALSEMGHQIRVLTGYPNYPDGEVFEGYTQRWRSQERYASADVLRVPLWTDHSLSPLRRMLNYISFGASTATARSFARGADVIYVYAPQMTPAFGPWLWRCLGGSPYVLHVQDLWPDSITGSSLIQGNFYSKVIDSTLTLWIANVYNRASAVIGIAPTMVKTLTTRGVDPEKAHLVYNWAGEDSHAGLPLASSSARTDTSRTHLLYAGNVGDMQDLDSVMAAVNGARDAGIHLTVLGDGVALPRIRALADSLDMRNVDFKGRVSRSELKPYYAAADFCLVTLRDLPNFRGTIPSKFQASLSHGTPVITTVGGDVRRLVENLRIGFTAQAENANSLESALRDAARLSRGNKDEMSQRAKSAYRDHFSQKAGIFAIEGILQQVSTDELSSS